MRNWLIIADGIVLEVLQKEGSVLAGEYTGYYDTIAEDPSGMFKKGDTYTIDQWEYYNSHFAGGGVQTISMRQCRLQLVKMGLDEAVEAAIEGMTDPLHKKFAKIEWEYATEVKRYNGWVEQIASMLHITPEQIDDMFIEASRL